VSLSRRRELAPRKSRLRAAPQLLVAEEGIEHSELVRGTSEAALLELPRHRDQPLADDGQILPGRGPPPRIRARTPVREDAARQHEAVLVLGPQLGQGRELLLVEQTGGQIELGLDVRLVALGADVGDIALGSEEKADRLGEDRLAGPGFARDGVQAGAENELRLVDEDEVLDSEPAQHLRRPW
jgi:hypothetical protein